jgi:7-keto-8-aminopelargonate synthetase-like enzyme
VVRLGHFHRYAAFFWDLCSDFVGPRGAPALGEIVAVELRAFGVGAGDQTSEGEAMAKRLAAPPERRKDWPELRAFERRRDALTRHNLTVPYFQVTEPLGHALSRCGARDVINFSSYDYLGLAWDERVLAAAAAARRWGTSASASRIAAGQRPVHGELEAMIAQTLGVESCLTMVGGYGTNVSVIGHLLGPEDVLLHDKLAHECILAGGRLSGAQLQAFQHNDVEDLERQLVALRPHARRVWIARAYTVWTAMSCHCLRLWP